MKYEPKECTVCGKAFIPRRFDQMTCGERPCVITWKNRNNRKYSKKNLRRSEYISRKPKPDTIVAIGYAERQRAATLAMVGKISTEL